MVWGNICFLQYNFNNIFCKKYPYTARRLFLNAVLSFRSPKYFTVSSQQINKHNQWHRWGTTFEKFCSTNTNNTSASSQNDFYDSCDIAFFYLILITSYRQREGNHNARQILSLAVGLNEYSYYRLKSGGHRND